MARGRPRRSVERATNAVSELEISRQKQMYEEARIKLLQAEAERQGLKDEAKNEMEKRL